MDQEYKNKLVRNLYEAVWAFRNSIDESTKDADVALAEIIYNATPYPGIVMTKLYDITEEAKKVKTL